MHSLELCCLLKCWHCFVEHGVWLYHDHCTVHKSLEHLSYSKQKPSIGLNYVTSNQLFRPVNSDKVHSNETITYDSQMNYGNYCFSLDRKLTSKSHSCKDPQKDKPLLTEHTTSDTSRGITQSELRTGRLEMIHSNSLDRVFQQVSCAACAIHTMQPNNKVIVSYMTEMRVGETFYAKSLDRKKKRCKPRPNGTIHYAVRTDIPFHYT